MTNVYPPCRDNFGKKIRGAIVYRTRQVGAKKLLWSGRILPAAYFLSPRY